MALTHELLRPLLPPNPSLRSLRLDCARLEDAAIACLARAGLHELLLLNCDNISGRLLCELGTTCRDLRSVLYTFSLRLGRLRGTCTPDRSCFAANNGLAHMTWMDGSVCHLMLACVKCNVPMSPSFTVCLYGIRILLQSYGLLL